MNRNRHEVEAETVGRMMELIGESVAFDAAVWSATDRRRDMDTASLVELFEGNQPATTAHAAPVTTPDTGASASDTTTEHPGA